MRLNDVAAFVKSANAGASMLTFDIGFKNEADFARWRDCGALTPDAIARLYPVAQSKVQIHAYAPALVIKISIPRPPSSGGVSELDFDGVQQFAPLLDIKGPDAVTAPGA